MSQITFEEKSEVINTELAKRRSRWFAKSITWMDYDDVCQLIRCHIYDKWEQWDQEKPIQPWLNKIISHKIINILRDNYYTFAKPCVNCPYNQSKEVPDGEPGDNLCGWTESKIQCAECPLYKKWEKNKKYAQEINSATNIHGTVVVSENRDNAMLDLDESVKKLHAKMKDELSEKHYKVYKLLCIDQLDDDEAAVKLGFISNEKGRKAGYKQIKNLRKILMEKVERVLRNNDIIIF